MKMELICAAIDNYVRARFTREKQTENRRIIGGTPPLDLTASKQPCEVVFIQIRSACVFHCLFLVTQLP